jgi:short-subunit dehydrogenase
MKTRRDDVASAKARSEQEEVMDTKEAKQHIALITGASSGIGKELARLHARRGGDLVLVARSEEKLAKLAAELEIEHGRRAMIIAQDLAQPSASRAVYDAVKAAGVQVDYLINNAGFGGRGAFHERRWEDDLAMIQLNIVALTELTRQFLPDLVARQNGKILNVSSTASLMPGPLQAVYYATKAYVTSFSNAIAEELRGTGVTVTALLPGATETEFARSADMEKTPLFANTKSASPVEVALAGYDAMLRGDMDVIAGVSFAQRMMWAAIPFTPKKMLIRQVRKMQLALAT